MKYIFRPSNSRGVEGWKDWLEITSATPHDKRASFFLSELRSWFRQWVFK